MILLHTEKVSKTGDEGMQQDEGRGYACYCCMPSSPVLLESIDCIFRDGTDTPI